VPFWHRGGLKDFKLTTFNAKAETIATAQTFREAFKRRRCLVPASCWYEWTGPKGDKTKWKFTSRTEPWLCLAGIWDRAVLADVGEVQSFTIITQPAGSPLNAYHDRAPVVLPREHWNTWLDTSADVSFLLRSESVDGSWSNKRPLEIAPRDPALPASLDNGRDLVNKTNAYVAPTA